MTYSDFDLNETIVGKQIIEALADNKTSVQTKKGSFEINDQIIEAVKDRGPEARILFKRVAPGEPWYFWACNYGQFYYYGTHPLELWWEPEPHKEIEGYEPLKVDRVDQIKKGDCYLCCDTLYEITTLPNYYGDYRVKPVNSRRSDVLGGGFDGLMYYNVNNRLYRQIKSSAK